MQKTLADEIIFGTADGVEKLLLAGANVNEIDVYGYTPLIEAAIVNSTEISRLLLQNGAAIDLTDVTGRTALHWATDNHNISLSKLLLDYKANPNAYTNGAQSILVYPLLRNQSDLKNLLYQYGADLSFAQDFIHAKLLGHRYHLMGQVDIFHPDRKFVEVDYEGFFLEVTLSIIRNSLERYRNNFAARKLRALFRHLSMIIDSFTNASELLKYQKYNIDIHQHAQKINRLLQQELLLLPVAYHGHAITFVRLGNLLAKVDRGENSLSEGSVNIYKINNPELLTPDFIKRLIYKPTSAEFVHDRIKKVLGLVNVAKLPVPSQTIGNCSWANVDATIPTMLFLLMLRDKPKLTNADIPKFISKAMRFYRQWIIWDQDRALEECVQSFYHANEGRKMSLATMLAAVLFQQCNYLDPRGIARAEKIIAILTLKEYHYIIDSYLEIYWKRKQTEPGRNLLNLLDVCGYKAK